ncbi:hypothetical protein D7V80_12235 [Corallococcus sp. CA054B]|uniref:hypothetical protein n=1 Tax=Corallococcus sp. CA054B TaxID=2316734 RepID=UPI000EA12D69|nr:hypothetical protein [Corallococcus sp. CA054B]RKG68515.1 hypothetical protein D7V80_12235 [Corallococcus sp. CA054B]
MKALSKSLVALAVLSISAFAPDALARPPACEDICGCSWVTCEDTCWTYSNPNTTCGESMYGCQENPFTCKIKPPDVDEDTSEAQSSSDDASARTCGESRQETVFSSQPARN